MSRRISFRTKKRQNKLGMSLVSVVVLMILVVISISSVDLQKKQAMYLEKQAQLQEQIEQQEQRAEDLVELKKYTQTKAYVEEVAKDKLGLVHSDEIVFEMEK